MYLLVMAPSPQGHCEHKLLCKTEPNASKLNQKKEKVACRHHRTCGQQWCEMSVCALQVDVVCGDHLLDHYQSLKDIQSTVGDEALQVRTTKTHRMNKPQL